MSDKSKREVIDNILQDSMIASGTDAYTITIDPSSYNFTSSNLTYSDNITITSLPYSSMQSTVSIPTTYTISTGGDGFNDIHWGQQEEWVNSFPDWQRVENMCKKYPGLEVALRNFRTVYTLVKDDYDNPKVKK
jgi:hypothetical protein